MLTTADTSLRCCLISDSEPLESSEEVGCRKALLAVIRGLAADGSQKVKLSSAFPKHQAEIISSHLTLDNNLRHLWYGC